MTAVDKIDGAIDLHRPPLHSLNCNKTSCHGQLKMTLDSGGYVGLCDRYNQQWLVREIRIPLPHQITYTGGDVGLKMETSRQCLISGSVYAATLPNTSSTLKSLCCFVVKSVKVIINEPQYPSFFKMPALAVTETKDSHFLSHHPGCIQSGLDFNLFGKGPMSHEDWSRYNKDPKQNTLSISSRGSRNEMWCTKSTLWPAYL